MDLCKTARRLAALFALSFAFAGGAVAADTQTDATLPAWYKWSWDIPLLRGEYMPIDGGTLGSLGVGFTEDANHTFGVANFFYDAHGNPQTWATGGVITLNDDATVDATGIIATTGISFYALSNGPCRGCADHPRDQVQTPDIGKFEWTGPRAGKFTFNGETQQMVEAFSGLPLVAPTNLAGHWVLVSRADIQAKSGGQIYHYENVINVTLVPVNPPRAFTAVTEVRADAPGPIGSVPLPPAGAKQYDIVCANSDSQCNVDRTIGSYGPHSFLTAWVGDDGVGRILSVRQDGSSYVVANTGFPFIRIYATNDRMVARRSENRANALNYQLEEYAFFRIGDATLKGPWRNPPCSLQPDNGCNPGG